MKEYFYENEWPWGKSVYKIIADGAASVDITFDKEDPGVAWISSLMVAPEERRKGYATQLLEWAINYCKENNIFRINLNSVEKDFVMKFYHKYGFKDIKEEDGFMRMYKML